MAKQKMEFQRTTTRSCVFDHQCFKVLIVLICSDVVEQFNHSKAEFFPHGKIGIPMNSYTNPHEYPSPSKVVKGHVAPNRYKRSPGMERLVV